MTGEHPDSNGSPGGGPVDLRLVLAEIDQEVKAKRSSGALPADFERDLDRSFARFAPVDAVTGDFSTLLSKLEDSTMIDTKAPTDSGRPGMARFKTVVAKAIDWDLRHLSSQVSGLAHALTRALGMLGERVDDLERDAPSALEAALMDIGPGPARAALPPGDWPAVVLAAMDGVEDRVVHTECGAGELVAALRTGGLDVYGVEPDGRLVLDAPMVVADVRHDTARDHLRLLPFGALGGVVLSGCVDRLPPAAILELVDLARSRLRAGGRLVVLSHHPRTWGGDTATAAVVASDLSGGRPLHPATWHAVLESKGFTGIEVHPGPLPDQLATTGGSHAEAQCLDAAIAVLNGLVGVPAGFAVSATR
jgi:SAM-dependent methyltransferase